MQRLLPGRARPDVVMRRRAAGVKVTVYGLGGSFACGTAGGQVGGDVVGREHAPGAGICQALDQIAHEVGVGEHLDRFAQPVQLTGGHHVGHMLATGDDGHGVAVFGTAQHLGPRRGLLGVDPGHRLAHGSQDTALQLLANRVCDGWVGGPVEILWLTMLDH